MKKIIVSAFAVAALAIPAVASADDGGGAYGKTWQDATGCTYGDIVRLVKANPNHPSINGLGAKNGLAAALDAIAAGHPVPTCS